MAAYSWRRLRVDDFPLLATWLARPHVARWWCHDTDEAAVRRDFGPAAAGEEPSEDLMVARDGVPFGFVQRSRYDDYPEHARELRSLCDVPPDAMTMDYFVAAAAHTGKGWGSAMVAALLADTWSSYRAADAVIVGVAAGNRPSWRLLERNGFRRVAEGDLTPDNPIDPPLHYIYRTNRPHHMGGPGR